MQPLTPNERRIVEGKLHFVTYLENPTMVSDQTFKIIINKDNRDLWLKVLSMALEHNEQIEKSWRGEK